MQSIEHKYLLIRLFISCTKITIPSYTVTKVDANKLNLNLFLLKYAPYSEITLFEMYGLILMTLCEDRMKKMTWHILSAEFINFLSEMPTQKEKLVCINITNSLIPIYNHCNHEMFKRQKVYPSCNLATLV